MRLNSSDALEKRPPIPFPRATLAFTGGETSRTLTSLYPSSRLRLPQDAKDFMEGTRGEVKVKEVCKCKDIKELASLYGVELAGKEGGEVVGDGKKYTDEYFLGKREREEQGQTTEEQPKPKGAKTT